MTMWHWIGIGVAVVVVLTWVTKGRIWKFLGDIVEAILD